MSGSGGGKLIDPSPKLELKLNLSPPKSRSSSSSLASHMSGSNSCLSSSEQPEEALSVPADHTNDVYNNDGHDERYHGSGGTWTEGASGGGGTTVTMRLLGCPRCLMYVMLAADEDGPRCPKCRSSVLLDFLNQHRTSI
ncbi:uncharacterized protein LOC116200543 [Punica granatum]|uniref:GIR1-like zinc ribbon domain-containing protein n=2 Tax=Punica granatum TaxID=22663 RepID=A0A218WLA6_PUNGR|nr:uncharacterized protein LOC116200543 [Punica granatum]OWM73614.1 hypothetical protein CDL15_Pgr026713 [Punica granatum]PKI35421.1 hypothetical protein CRG98_044191 [Punica granatum]